MPCEKRHYSSAIVGLSFAPFSSSPEAIRSESLEHRKRARTREPHTAVRSGTSNVTSAGGRSTGTVFAASADLGGSLQKCFGRPSGFAHNCSLVLARFDALPMSQHTVMVIVHSRVRAGYRLNAVMGPRGCMSFMASGGVGDSGEPRTGVRESWLVARIAPQCRGGLRRCRAAWGILRRRAFVTRGPLVLGNRRGMCQQ